MNKNKVLKCLSLIICIIGTIDISMPEYEQEYPNNYLSAGINGKTIKQGAKVVQGWLKNCTGHKKAGQVINKKLVPINRIITATEMLGKNLEEINAQEEVLPKIGKFLSQTKPNEGGTKVINCIRTEANEVRMCLLEQGIYKPTKDKIIRIADAIDMIEYDVQAMQENFYKGIDGVEYVEFIIPRRPQYILNGQYDGRIYECMVFNIPKDINGNWEKFKEYLIRFLNDLMSRPTQLWDEYWFRHGLAELNINSRDVQEMERYLFAQTRKNNRENEIIKSIWRQIA